MSTTFTLDTSTSRANPTPTPMKRLTVPLIQRRKFEGNALIRRLMRLGVIDFGMFCGEGPTPVQPGSKIVVLDEPTSGEMRPHVALFCIRQPLGLCA